MDGRILGRIEEQLTRNNVLLEDVQTKVNALSEGHEDVVARLDRMDIRFDAMDIRFDAMDHRLDKVELRLDSVDHRLDKVELRLDSVDHRLDKIEHHVGFNGKPATRRPSRTKKK